jgi:hypothetical protein
MRLRHLNGGRIVLQRSHYFNLLFFLPAGERRLRDPFRAPINLLGFSPKRHAMIGLFLADSDLNPLFALPRDQLQEVAQLRIALSSFRSAGCIDFARVFLAFEFPDGHSVFWVFGCTPGCSLWFENTVRQDFRLLGDAVKRNRADQDLEVR